MRVLLAGLHFGLIRNFESVVAGLSARGHDVVLASEERDRFGGDELAESLRARLPGVSIEQVPDVGQELAVDLGSRLRLALDYLRFQAPAFHEFTKLRDRMPERLPYFAKRFDLAAMPGARRLVAGVERALPDSRRLAAWLEGVTPDVVLLASLTHSRSIQPALLRAAIARRTPSVACIYSWDHLSSKAHIIDVPDRVLVWNRIQKDEAVRLHGLPDDRIEVTGAQCYDQWFESRPSRERAEFCRDCGLDPSRPFILYTCSALTPSPDEPRYVMEFIAGLRRSESRVLREVGVLLRPHPERVHEWNGVDHAGWDNVAYRPRSGAPDTAKREYIDAVHHSSAVVGVVTSAFLEAAIVGRPVLTPMLPMFAPHQWGAQHFRYLLDVEDGLPIVGRTLDEHLSQLQGVLTGELEWRPRQQRFLDTFIGPAPGPSSATSTFVTRVEEAAAQPSRAYRRAPGVLGRAAAPMVMALAGRPGARRWLHDDAERENDRRKAWESQHRDVKETVRDARYELKAKERRERERQQELERERRDQLKRDRYRARDRERQRQRLDQLRQRVLGRVRRALGRTSA